MSGLFKQKTPKFIPPAAVQPPPPAVAVEAAPTTEVQSGGDSSVDSTPSTIRRKYRPSKGIAGNGTGLSV